MTEKEKIYFNKLIEKIIFDYDPIFENKDYKVEETFKKAVKFIGGTTKKDLFSKELNNSFNCQTYKEEFQSVGKVLLKWLKKSEE